MYCNYYSILGCVGNKYILPAHDLFVVFYIIFMSQILNLKSKLINKDDFISVICFDSAMFRNYGEVFSDSKMRIK